MIFLRKLLWSAYPVLEWCFWLDDSFVTSAEGNWNLGKWSSFWATSSAKSAAKFLFKLVELVKHVGSACAVGYNTYCGIVYYSTLCGGVYWDIAGKWKIQIKKWLKLKEPEMRNHRRGRCEIVKSILEAARGGAIKTKIMKKARVNNAQANGYLATLEKHDLLSRVELSTGKSIVWKTTETGLKVVEACEKCHSLLSEIL